MRLPDPLPVLSAAEMSAADRSTVGSGTPLHDLMENAGGAVASFCLQQYPHAGHVLVLCGKGKNGGDGLVAARVLAESGVGVRVLLVAAEADLDADAADALASLKQATSDEVVEEFHQSTHSDKRENEAASGEVGDLITAFAEADLIVDAVFGTGFKAPMRGAAILVRDALAKTSVPVLAVDLPSGWDADSLLENSPDAFRASSVVTFTAPKAAHVLGHLTASVFGPVVVAGIGSPDEAVHSASNLFWSGSSASITQAPRPINSNKGKFGHVLVIGGSYGTAGAPSMASLACMRAGAGLVTAAVPREIVNLIGSIAPELMVRGLEAGAEGSASAKNVEHLDTLLKGISVIALGPGLSTRGEASLFARSLLQRTALPLVLDADGLNAFDSSHAASLDGSHRTLVITPHPGEMARLLGATVAEVEADRINIARKFATGHSVTLVLKGWRTLIAHPDGRVAVNTSGNPALAKGGSGDILTGIIAAMLAQYPDQVGQAVEAAVYLHGIAADFAAHAMHEKTVLATDVIDQLSHAFGYRAIEEDGVTWLCGLRQIIDADAE